MSYLLFPSDTSTGEDDNFTGFDSGSSSADKGRDNEEPRFFPRISRTNSNRVFVTSGVGEDKGGSQHNDRSHSKSHESGKQGSANEDEDFGSTMDLAKSTFLYLHAYVTKRSLNAFYRITPNGVLNLRWLRRKLFVAFPFQFFFYFVYGVFC